MMELGIEAAAVFFDFTKAFDSVPHKPLIEKLQAIGLDAYLVQWITDYLTNRMQYVVVNGVASKPLSVISGVPHAGVCPGAPSFPHFHQWNCWAAIITWEQTGYVCQRYSALQAY